MSGIAGIIHFDGKPVEPELIGKMTSAMAHCGPEGTGTWNERYAGLGHMLLATTPEALFERLPLRDDASGCVITADARLDNRKELLVSLGALSRFALIGDAEIILLAYLSWGKSCVERFLGDFAFAIWDPCGNMLFCARDHFGVKPFYYHHTPGRFIAFASEPGAILGLPQAPYRINEGRIADFLISQLEGIDKTSTFFEEVYRLPPAHMLIVTPGAMHQHCYWTLEPGPELCLSSNEAYAEAFLDVFTEAVRCRLRGVGPVGSMLSGGMDSGSIVAMARDLLARAGQGPLPTFSAISPDDEGCVETRTIRVALTMGGLAPHIVNHGQLDKLMPDLEYLTWNLAEPFDSHMTLVRAIYLAAHRQGINVLLDGIDGDNVLSEGSYLARLLLRGSWLTAYREAAGQYRFWGDVCPTWRELLHGARTAFVPEPLRQLRRRLRSRYNKSWLEENIRASIIRPAFARRVALSERLGTLEEHWLGGLPRNLPQESARTIDSPYLTAGVERYHRVAAAIGVEPRHPFLDRRVVAFCVALPGEQKLNQGWPKAILRRAMAGRLPDAVRWRRGKEHLGWAFTSALMGKTQARIRGTVEANWDLIRPYVDVDNVRRACAIYFDNGGLAQAEKVYEAAHLIAWLRLHAERFKGTPDFATTREPDDSGNRKQ